MQVEGSKESVLSLWKVASFSPLTGPFSFLPSALPVLSTGAGPFGSSAMVALSIGRDVVHPSGSPTPSDGPSLHS